MEEDLRPLAPGPEEDVPDALGPARPRGAPQPVTLLEVEPVSGLHPRGVRVAVGVQGTLGMLRRPRGVEDESTLVRRRILSGEVLRGPFHRRLVGFPAVAFLA